MRRHVVAILNPVAGRGSVLPVMRSICRHLHQAGCRCEISATENPGHATILASTLPSDVEAVLAVGGDGTVREVAEGLAGRRVPIAILPTGTENLLAREFRMPATPAEVGDVLLHAKSVSCDIGVANDRCFLAVAGVGFDAECVARLSQERRGHITYLDYFWPIWRTFWSHRFPRLTIEVDDSLIFEGRGFALIGNIRRYATGLRILAKARTDDGLLDVCVFRCATRRAFMAHAFRTSLGRHDRHPAVAYRRGRHVLVTSPDQVKIEIDGDTAGHLPLDCTILPSATSFLRAGRSGRKKANGSY